MAVLTWSLIFGGMLSFALGWTVRRNDAALGWVLIAASGVAVVVGIILVWIRSRMADGPD
jgi:hypothetical protein